VDAHVHFNDPGFTNREDFLTGTSAAASGGVTTVIDMPCTSVPSVTSLDALRTKEEAVRGKALVDYGFFGGVSAQSFAQGFPRLLGELAPEVLGLKVYMLSGMAEFERLGPYEIREVLSLSASLGLPVLVHAEDPVYVAAATESARSRGSSPADYYSSRPVIAELLAAVAAVTLAEEVGVAVAGVVKLDGNENPYGPSPRVKRALARYPYFHIYPDPYQKALRKGLAAYAGVGEESIVAGAGSDELIDLILRLFLDPGDGVMNLPPTFGMYPFSTLVCGGEVVEAPRDEDFHIDLEGAK
jgi:hypothetical protein